MCRCLSVQPSGFYAWLKDPLSRRAQKDQRQTDLIYAAWRDSGRVYDYRKLHDDLADMGENCSPNRVAHLSRLAGIRAQIGYRRRPGHYGGKPSLAVDNMLDRQLDAEAPDKTCAQHRERRIDDEPRMIDPLNPARTPRRRKPARSLPVIC